MRDKDESSDRAESELVGEGARTEETSDRCRFSGGEKDASLPRFTGDVDGVGIDDDDGEAGCRQDEDSAEPDGTGCGCCKGGEVDLNR